MIADDPEITLNMFLSVYSSSCWDLEWILTVSLILVHFSFFYYGAAPQSYIETEIEYSDFFVSSVSL